MKRSRLVSILTTLSLGLGLLTFVPSVEAANAAGATCAGATCSQTFAYSASAQTFTPSNAGVTLTITLNGGAGGHGGADAGGGGGVGYLGSRVVFNYTTTSANPLYLYVGNAGGNGTGGSGNGQGAGGANAWAAYAGGAGGYAGGTGSSGAGGGGGGATLVATGSQTGVLAVAGGGGGGGGANINTNGLNGNPDTGTQANSTAGGVGNNVGGGDGAGGGGGGGGYTGGVGGAAAYDGWNPAGGGGVTGKSFPAPAAATITGNAQSGAGSITITWPNGPSASQLPSFTDSSIAKVGQVLTPADGTFVPSAGASATISNRRWQVSTDGVTFTDISPTVSGNYTIAAGDVGKYVRFAENATDSNSTVISGSLPSLQITGAPAFTSNLTAVTAGGASANEIVNTALSPTYTFTASGYRDVFTVSAGSLPTGITLNPSTGLLSGTATQTGTYKYKVTVTNDAGSAQSAELALVVGQAPVFTSDDTTLQSVNRFSNPIRVGAALPNFTFATAAYPSASLELKTDSTTIPVCGTAPACAYSYETLGLPLGLTFDPATGILSGTPTKTGAYVFAVKATNSVGSSLDFIHMSIAAKAPSVFSMSSDKQAVTIVQGTTVTATVTATGGDGNGAYSFSVDSSSTGICSVAAATATTATVTALAAGTCVINGVKAADAGFAAARTSVTLTINKALQSAALTLTLDTNPLDYATQGATWARGTGGNGTGAFTFTVDPSSASVCTVRSDGYTTRLSAGTCLINVVKAADAYFLAQTGSITLTINKSNQSGFYIGNPGAANWNATTAPSVSLNTAGGQSTGAVTYSLDPNSSKVCTLVGNVLTALSAGTCSVTAVKAGDVNYNPLTSAAVTWTINQIAQPALSVTAASTAGAVIAGNQYVPYVANPAVLAVISVAGGAGTGSYSYSTSNSANCVISGAGSTAFVTVAPSGSGVGWCVITAVKNGDINYTAQTGYFQFYIPAATTTSLTATPAKLSVDYNAATQQTDQITVTGAMGTGALTYSVAAQSTQICSVDANGLVTDKTAGTCVINVSKAADSNYTIQNTTATITFNKLAQAELVATLDTTSEPFVWSPKATDQITTTGGTGTGGVTYAVDSSSTSVCSVNASTGLITDITAGTCLVNVTKAADVNYNVVTDQVSVVFTKINPAAITLTASPASITYAPVNKQQTWVSVAGGANSTGATTFFIDPMTEDYCSIAIVQPTQILINGNKAGLCLIIAIKAADVNYNETRAFIGVNINKMAQTIGATSSNSTSFVFKDSQAAETTINVTGVVGSGTSSFVVDAGASTSNCSVDQTTGVVTSSTTGVCKVTVSNSGDDNVLASNNVVLTLTINKATQTAVIATPATSNFTTSVAPAAAATSLVNLVTTGSGTGLFTKIVSATPAICTITGGGDSTVTPPTFAATANPTITVTAVSAGTCLLTYSKLGDANYNPQPNGTMQSTFGVPATLQNGFVITKATQAALNSNITAGSATMPFVASPKATATIATTGGSGTGAVSFAIDPSSNGICTVNASTGVVTDTTAGICTVIATKATDANYAAATQTTVITFNKIDQATFTASAAKTALAATTTALDSTTVSSTGGSSTGAVSYAVDPASAGVCSISGTTVTEITPGSCVIIATKAADVNYNVATASVTLTITKGNQTPLTASWAPNFYYYTPINFDPAAGTDSYFGVNGGSGSGDLKFTIDPASATVCKAVPRSGVPSQLIISSLSAGTCTISVYKDGGVAWNNSNTVTASLTINKIGQAALSATPSVSTLAYFGPTNNNTFTVSTTGGSSTGATSVTVSTPLICADATLPGGPLTIKTLGVGTCSFTATKAADISYTAITSASVNVTITKGTQTALVLAANPSSMTYAVSPSATSTLTLTGGSGNGASVVSVDSSSTAVCSYNPVTGVLTAIMAGNCEITATKAAGADGLFNAATTHLTVVISKITQTPLALTPATPSLMFSDSPKPTSAFTLTGGSGTGAISYSVDPVSSGVCSVTVANNVPTITANYFGYCVLNVTKAGDANYAPATAQATVRIAQPGSVITANAANAIAPFVDAPGAVNTITVTGSLPNDTLSYSVDSASRSICSVSGSGTTATVISLSTGICNVLAINITKAPDGTLIASSSVATFTIVKGAQTGVVATPATSAVNYAVPAPTDVITVTGGTPNASITASVDASSVGNCSVAVNGNKVTMTGLQVGDCLINITKSGDALHNDATVQVDVTILKTAQAVLVARSNPTSTAYPTTGTATTTLSATGGSGTGAVSFAVAPSSSSICSVTNNIMTVITGGDCVVIATKAGDQNYADATASVTITISKGTQAAVTETALATSLTFDPTNPATTTVAAVGGSGRGAFSYAVAPASASVCSIVDNIVTALSGGSCVVIATKASDPFFDAATASVTINIAKAAQGALVASSADSSITYNPTAAPTTTLSATGGSGSGAVTFAVDPTTSNICSVVNNVVTGLLAGDCKVIATKAGDSQYNATTANLTITVAKATQAPLVATAASPSVYFAVSPATTDLITVTGGTGLGSTSAIGSADSASVCSVVKTGANFTVTALHSGNCVITVTKAGNANYLDVSVDVTITVQKNQQAALNATASPAVISYAASPLSTTTITVTGGSGSGATTFAIDPSTNTVCSVNSNVVSALTGGDCVIQVTKAGDADYAPATTSVTVHINKGTQAALTEAAANTAITFDPSHPATTTVSASGGSGSGAISYAVDQASATVCSITDNVVTALTGGSCVIIATKATDAFFNAATASVTIAIAKANQQALTGSSADASLTYNPTSNPTTTVSAQGGSGTGAISYSVDPAAVSFCSVTGNVVTGLLAGNCVIVATKAADSQYKATSVSIAITIARAAQPALTATPAASRVFFAVSPATTDLIAIAGGAGTGATRSVLAGNSTTVCSITGSGLSYTATALHPGDCVITFTKAGDANYLDASVDVTITVQKIQQAALVLSANPSALTFAVSPAATTTITAAGGSGAGAFSYAIDASSNSVCSIVNNVVTALSGGDCVIQVTKAGDTDYAAATAAITVKIAKAAQSTLTATADASTLTYALAGGVTTLLHTSGGSGTGTVTYAVAQASATICSVDGNVLTALLPGTCSIVATKAADANFSAASANVTVTINKSAQAALNYTVGNGELSNPQWNGKTTSVYVIGGGNGTGSMTATSLTPLYCSVALAADKLTITAIADGSCEFTVAKAGDANFLAATTLDQIISIASAATDLTLTIATSGKAVAGGTGGIDLTIQNLGPAKAANAKVEYTLPTGVTAVLPLPAGCTLTGIKITCLSNKILDVNGSVVFSIPVNLDSTLVGGSLTSGGQVLLSSDTPDSQPSNNSASGAAANFTVSKMPAVFTDSTLGALQTGKAFTDGVAADGFPTPTYTVSAGDLPAGLTLDPTTGAITGVPTGSGAYSFTITAYNAAGSVSKAFTGTVAPAPFVTAPAAGFGTNTVPAGTKVVIGGVNLNLITSATIGGLNAKLSAQSATSVSLDVPNSTTSQVAQIVLTYAQGTLPAGTFTYTGVAKLTPNLVLNAGALTGGAGENARTLSTAITADGVSDASNLPVTYSSKTPTVCAVAGNQLSFLAAGTCTLSASSAANSAFNAATSAPVSVVLTKSSQTITLVDPTKTVPATATTDSADGFDVNANTSSALPASFVSTTPDVCDVTDDGHVSGIKPGTCVLSVTQAGDNRFNAATPTTMTINITKDPGLPVVDNGDPLHPTNLANGALNNMGDAGFTWNKKLGALSVQTYGIWIGKIAATSEFTIGGKNYSCTVNFGILKKLPSNTPALKKIAMARKTFKASAPFCNAKTEAAAFKALKAGYAGLNVKVTIIRYRLYPTTYLPINAVTKKPITTMTRVLYLTLG